MALNSKVFEDFVFHKSFVVLWLLIAGSFKRMGEHAMHCLELIGDVWSDNDEFISFHTLWALIVTAFLGSIAISYFVITSFTIVMLAMQLAAAFLILTIIFAVYQVIMGIMFGIVDAFAAYIASLSRNTFNA